MSAESKALLDLLPAVYRTRIDEVLLTALVRAFGRWTGVPALLVDVEGHGREAPAGEACQSYRSVSSSVAATLHMSAASARYASR